MLTVKYSYIIAFTTACTIQTDQVSNTAYNVCSGLKRLHCSLQGKQQPHGTQEPLQSLNGYLPLHDAEGTIQMAATAYCGWYVSKLKQLQHDSRFGPWTTI